MPLTRVTVSRQMIDHAQRSSGWPSVVLNSSRTSIDGPSGRPHGRVIWTGGNAVTCAVNASANGRPSGRVRMPARLFGALR